MSKLYKDTPRVLSTEKLEEGVLPDENIGETLMEDGQVLESSIEASEMALERLQTLEGMKSHLESQKLCSAPYLYSVESYSPLIKSMGERLGVKHFPSMEAFSSPRAAKDSHEFAVEGFKEMISKAWEKIKAFFRSFFKNISLFMKRIVNANLELKDYEAYCEKLIAKLSVNNGKLNDSSPMVSSLPALLANEGMSRVDSTYILNQGRIKMLGLLDETVHLTTAIGGGSLNKRLEEFARVLKLFATSSVDSGDLDASIAVMKGNAFGILSGLFKHSADLDGKIPKNAYQAISSHYHGLSIKSEDVQVMSVYDPSDLRASLPRGVNLFMCHVAKDNLFVMSSRDNSSSADSKLQPIGNVTALSDFYKLYKDSIGSFDFNKTLKGGDDVAKSVDHILDVIQKNMGNMLERFRVTPSDNSSIKGLTKVIETLLASSSNSSDTLQNTTSDVVNAINAEGEGLFSSYQGNLETLTDQLFVTINDLARCIVAKNSSGVDEMQKTLYDLFKSGGNAMLPFVILQYKALNSSAFPIEQDVETINTRYESLKELENSLRNLFTRFTLTYKSIVTDFCGVLTELRYAVIKYIYDSARRYSY